MAGAKLRGLAVAFAQQTEELLNGTVASGAIVSATELAPDVYLVAPGPPLGATGIEKLTGLVPASIDLNPTRRAESPIWLKIRYQLTLDEESAHLTTNSSMFGWCTNHETARCPIRVEYERYKAQKPASHIQVDGESAGWAYGLGRLGRDHSSLQKLHLPLGGRRFRPSLEDFIEFLIQEQMIPGKHAKWKDGIEDGRLRWESLQTRATVRRNPTDAAKQLRRMGYTVKKTTKSR